MKSNHLVLGILAHVDAGKTTLSESILYHTGSIRKTGRVDHQDTFLDNDAQERERGITIFSKQAELRLYDKEITLLDTPGHVDFSAEMERTLSVLDYAILIVSGADGVQGHVLTLWKLLKRYQVPVFIFVNKMDQNGTDKERTLTELRKELSEHCVDFSELAEKLSEEACKANEGSDAGGTGNIPAAAAGKGSFEAAAVKDREEDNAAYCNIIERFSLSEERSEEIALCSEALTERYLEESVLPLPDVRAAVSGGRLIPCCFGSALKDEGVDAFLRILSFFMQRKEYPNAFSARVYKITRDKNGNRLTHLKLTGGSLRAKEEVPMLTPSEQETFYEKADQLRLYSGLQFQPLKEAKAGMVIAVTGLTKTKAGMGLGAEEENELPILVPLFSYALIPPFDTDRQKLYLHLKELEEELPEIAVSYEEKTEEINVKLMGDVQTEVLKRLILERYQTDVSFSEGKIVYMESIETAAEGVGHFEPLRHYAEVHLLLEPAERGSGMHFDIDLKEEGLSGSYQRLILQHLSEKPHVGVLTGAELTDVKITLLAGKSHEKHTEGGDFREATYRAVRHGLMRAKSVLLEPYYSYRLSVPRQLSGRAIADLQRMQASFKGPFLEGETAVLEGKAAVSMMRGYAAELSSYTKGFGRLQLQFCGYDRCLNEADVVLEAAYDPEADLQNQPGSVFCTHGAGFYVPWNEVETYMHLPYVYKEEAEKDKGELDGKHGFADDRLSAGFGSKRPAETAEAAGGKRGAKGNQTDYMGAGYAADKELEEIFRKTFGAAKREQTHAKGLKPDLFQRNVPGWKKQKGKSGGDEGTRERRGEQNDPRRPFVSVPDPKKQYLLVDGYNIIFAWEELREMAAINIDSARLLLMDLLSNYQGYRGMNLIVVFDAYKVRGGKGEVQNYHNIYVVYTKEAETADQYIEKTVHDMDKRHRVTVATSDGLEQMIVFGEGAVRMSARELHDEVLKAGEDIRELIAKKEGRLQNRMQIKN